MKLVMTLCDEIRYKEFPDLLFGKSCDNSVYFDSTHYIQVNGDVRKHSVKNFELGFIHWINAISEAYSIPRIDLIVQDETTGHILIDESLALLFVAYIDPEFGIYMLERMSEMLYRGITLSDTHVLMLANERLTEDQLSNLSK